MSNTFATKVSGRMSSRGWALALGIGAVVLAGILLVVYLDRYRSEVSSESAPTPVLVAKRLIPKGTPGTLIASQQMYAPTTLPQKEVEVGAVSDPQYLVGQATATDIFPGQQFAATDFVPADTASVDSQITGTERAISITMDDIHGSLSQVQPGDFVDVYIGLGGSGRGGTGQLYKLFRPNVKVMAIPSIPGPTGSSNLVLRIDTKDAADWALAGDSATLYFVLRPVAGAKPTKRDTATAANLLR